MNEHETTWLTGKETEKFHDEAYERYRLDFMSKHGLSLSQLANQLIDYYEEKKHVYTEPGTAFSDGADVLADWAESTGFSNNEIWLGKTAFLAGPYQDENYMEGLLSNSEDLLHRYHADRNPNPRRKEEPYTMRLYMRPEDYAALNNDVESFVISGVYTEKDRFYGYFRTGDYVVGISGLADAEKIQRKDSLPFLPISLDIYQLRPDLSGIKSSTVEEIGQVIMEARTSFPSTHSLMNKVLETIKNNIAIIGQTVTEKNFQEAFCSKDINKYDRCHFVMDGVYKDRIEDLPMIAQGNTKDIPVKSHAKSHSL